MKADGLPLAVHAFLTELDCLRPEDTVCCALSGGADSVCLLRCLLALSQEWKITLSAVHINHHLRGAESDRDAAFCRELCEALAVPLQILDVDAAQYARQMHCSEELAARTCRYEAFSQVQADWIATAHTASDNAETLVHRLIRGIGLHGLCAIPPRNGRFLRPLLTVTREQVEQYLAQLHQDFVTDSTNLTDQYTRNRIRHQIMPRMKELNPSVERTVSYTIHGLRRDADFLSQQAQEAYARCHAEKNTLAGLVQLHPALQVRCIAMLLEEAGLSYDAPLLERLQKLLYKGGRWNLSGAVFAAAKQGILTLEVQKPQTKPDPVLLQWGENCLYPGCVVTAELITAENSDSISIVHGKFANSILDYDKIKGDVFLHPREPGARMQLCGCNFTSSLKKRIQEKVPKEKRSTLHLLYDAAGVIYAEDIGVAERVRADAASERLLVVQIHREAP